MLSLSYFRSRQIELNNRIDDFASKITTTTTTERKYFKLIDRSIALDLIN